MVAKKTSRRKPTTRKKNFWDVLSTTWFRLTFITTIIGVGFATAFYIYDTFPTKEHVQGRYVPKTELMQKENVINNKIKDVDSQATQTLKEFKGQYRLERLSDIMQQINLLEKQILLNPSNKSLENYKCMLEKEAEKLRDRIDTGK